MEEKADYFVNTEDRSLEELLAEGRKEIELRESLADISDSMEKQKIAEAWEEIDSVVIQQWPWMEKYLNKSDNQRKYHLNTSYPKVNLIIPQLVPIDIKIVRVEDTWLVSSLDAFTVYQITGDTDAYISESITGRLIYKPVIWNGGENRLVFEKDKLAYALATAEENWKQYDERMRDYQNTVDQKQIEELKPKEAIERPEDRFIKSLRELIQNEICNTCSHCG